MDRERGVWRSGWGGSQLVKKNIDYFHVSGHSELFEIHLFWLILVAWVGVP